MTCDRNFKRHSNHHRNGDSAWRVVFAAVVLVFATSITTPANAQFSDAFSKFFGTDKKDEEPNTDPAKSESGAKARAIGDVNADKRDLGAAPVAMVEDIMDAPKAGVEFLDNVTNGQNIVLGKNGRVVLSHLDGCLTETITGGTVTVKVGGSSVAEGKIVRKGAACAQVAAVTDAAASEAGLTVNRINPLAELKWSERVVNSALPVFRWAGAKGAAKFRVLALDHEKPRVVWEWKTSNNHVTYSTKAAPLDIGLPYQAEVVLADGARLVAVFSIDKGLDVQNSVANRVVELGL